MNDRYMEITLWLSTGFMLILGGMLTAFLSLLWLEQQGLECMVFLLSLGLVFMLCGMMNSFIGFVRLPYPATVRI